MPRKSSESDSASAPPKVKVTRETLGQMFSLYTYLRPYRGKLGVGLFMLIASTLLGLFFPLLAGVLINSKSHDEAFRVAVLMAVADHFCRHQMQIAVSHPGFGDGGVGEGADISGIALEHSDLQTVLVVEMHMQGG